MLRFFSFLFKDCESLGVVLLTVLVVFEFILFNDEEDNGNEKLFVFEFSKSGDDIGKLLETGLEAAPTNTLLFVSTEFSSPSFTFEA